MSAVKSVKKTVDLLSEACATPVRCRISDGGLIPALAPVKQASSLPSGVIYAAHSEGIGRFFICTSGNIYISGSGKSYSSLSALSGDSPFLVEEISDGSPCAYLIRGANAVRHTGSSFKTFAYGANLACGVMHCGRLFGADYSDRNKLRWSGEGGVSDWEEGLHGSGSLDLDPERGDILDIVEYGEKLVLVRKYGLTVMSAFGAPENYKVAITDTDCDEIYKRTACVAGGKLLFYSSSGLRSFDGSVIRLIEHRCAEGISSPTFAVECGGRYFLSCTSASLGGRAVLCCDVQDGESYFIDIAADGLCVGDGVYACCSDSCAYTLEEGGGYLYKCLLNFGTSRSKTVTEIYADCTGADISITNGRVSRAFSGASGAVRPRLRGRKFTVTVTGDVPVKKLTATAEVSLGI